MFYYVYIMESFNNLKNNSYNLIIIFNNKVKIIIILILNRNNFINIFIYLLIISFWKIY